MSKFIEHFPNFVTFESKMIFNEVMDDVDKYLYNLLTANFDNNELRWLSPEGKVATHYKIAKDLYDREKSLFDKTIEELYKQLETHTITYRDGASTANEESYFTNSVEETRDSFDNGIDAIERFIATNSPDERFLKRMSVINLAVVGTTTESVDSPIIEVLAEFGDGTSTLEQQSTFENLIVPYENDIEILKSGIQNLETTQSQITNQLNELEDDVIILGDEVDNLFSIVASLGEKRLIAHVTPNTLLVEGTTRNKVNWIIDTNEFDMDLTYSGGNFTNNSTVPISIYLPITLEIANSNTAINKVLNLALVNETTTTDIATTSINISGNISTNLVAKVTINPSESIAIYYQTPSAVGTLTTLQANMTMTGGVSVLIKLENYYTKDEIDNIYPTYKTIQLLVPAETIALGERITLLNITSTSHLANRGGSIGIGLEGDTNNYFPMSEVSGGSVIIPAWYAREGKSWGRYLRFNEQSFDSTIDIIRVVADSKLPIIQLDTSGIITQQDWTVNITIPIYSDEDYTLGEGVVLGSWMN